MSSKFDNLDAQLLCWGKGPAAFERLVAQILRIEGFVGVLPNQPGGGADGGVDIMTGSFRAQYADRQKEAAVAGSRQEGDQPDDAHHLSRAWAFAATFSRKVLSPSTIRTKACADLKQALKFHELGQYRFDAFGFVTNQTISLDQRGKLREALASQKGFGERELKIYDREALVSILSSPFGWGAREEFFGIEVSRSETLSFMAMSRWREQSIEARIRAAVAILGWEIKSWLPRLRMKDAGAIFSSAKGLLEKAEHSIRATSFGYGPRTPDYEEHQEIYFDTLKARLKEGVKYYLVCSKPRDSADEERLRERMEKRKTFGENADVREVDFNPGFDVLIVDDLHMHLSTLTLEGELEMGLEFHDAPELVRVVSRLYDEFFQELPDET